MRELNRKFILMIIGIVAIIVAANVFLPLALSQGETREYRIDISRLANDIKSGNGVDISKYSSVKKVTELKNGDDVVAFMEGDGSDYLIKNINGKYYRFDYLSNGDIVEKKIIVIVNIAMISMGIIVIGFMMFLRVIIINPFNKIYNLPYELAKGNLTSGLKENENRYFGKFLWGLDMLRETLEDKKRKELMLQKEKKTLILSISHDIKTPLSAIKLYSQALTKNLYNSDEKRLEIAKNINNKADEIERYVSDIIRSSNEEFLEFEVKSEEFYLRDFLEKVIFYYRDKLDIIKTDFIVNEYTNCLVRGDMDRIVEVLQNIIENAIKYGDGKYIDLDFSEEEDYRIITISNSGCTLSKDEFSHIFDSFWRGSNAKNIEGSGLGLHIARELMHLMGGDIFAEENNNEMRISIVLKMA